MMTRSMPSAAWRETTRNTGISEREKKDIRIQQGCDAASHLLLVDYGVARQEQANG
jgi:hypothetical protein